MEGERSQEGRWRRSKNCPDHEFDAEEMGVNMEMEMQMCMYTAISMWMPA